MNKLKIRSLGGICIFVNKKSGGQCKNSRGKCKNSRSLEANVKLYSEVNDIEGAHHIMDKKQDPVYCSFKVRLDKLTKYEFKNPNSNQLTKYEIKNPNSDG